MHPVLIVTSKTSRLFFRTPYLGRCRKCVPLESEKVLGTPEQMLASNACEKNESMNFLIHYLLHCLTSHEVYPTEFGSEVKKTEAPPPQRMPFLRGTGALRMKKSPRPQLLQHSPLQSIQMRWLNVLRCTKSFRQNDIGSGTLKNNTWSAMLGRSWPFSNSPSTPGWLLTP